MVLIRVFEVSRHVWETDFFVALTEKIGSFVCIYEHTAKGNCFDYAIIMLNVDIGFFVLENISVLIDGKEFSLTL